MSELILHHYPQSPVTEKVRIALGIKKLRWRSVEIPRLPPRPLLIPMTGGYRRTPVLQIGSDIFCDSQCILRELDRRFPEYPLVNEPLGEMAWSISRWIDGPVFTSAIAVVLGSAKDLPADFAADRWRLYFGEHFKLECLQQEVRHHVSQLRGQLEWADHMLQSQYALSLPFFSGSSPGLVDIMMYYIVWFVSGRWDEGDNFLQEFSQLVAWQSRMKSIGHGSVKEISAEEALSVASHSFTSTEIEKECFGESDWQPGMKVSILPDVGGGDPEVQGDLISINSTQIAIKRSDSKAGNVVIHFPRIGYRINPI
ncbi:MAG: glutathione S-transferase [Gammaproteobacteria bacterium]|nr:glutathione S-transferase [Gammaproteobacteria bacterium]